SRNATAAATSSARASRRSGVWEARIALARGEMSATMSVSAMPGATAFTVMPEGPVSIARQRVNAARAAFAVTYPVILGGGVPYADWEVTFTIRPNRRETMS